MLKGKRLLLLGGNMEKDYLRSFANTNGVTLIGAGNNPEADYMKITDEKYNINNTDISIMKRFLIEKEIDGVYLGSNETVIKAAVKYINEIGLPCYCTEKQWDTLQNKKSFKQLCREYDLPVVHDFLDKESIEYPVIIKPARGNGSKGISVCRNGVEFEQGYKKATTAGFGDEIIIEHLLENHDTCCVYYTISNGKIYFSGMNDKYHIYYNNTKSYVGACYIYKSIFENDFREKFEHKIFDMLNGFGIKDGVISIEIYHKDNNYFFGECELRQSGNAAFCAANYLYGINQIDMICKYALTGKGAEINLKEREDNYCIYPIHLKQGHIDKIDGLERLSEIPSVIHIDKKVHLGDDIVAMGDYGNICFTIGFLFKDRQELFQIIDCIKNTVHVWDRNKDLTNYLFDEKLIQWRN